MTPCLGRVCLAPHHHYPPFCSCRYSLLPQRTLISCLAEVECPSYTRALSVIEAGCAARSVGATHLNERSSRAHTIVRVQLEGWGPPTPSNAEIRQQPQQQQQGGQELRSTALLHFVDLAGSERLARTGTSGIRWD
eukprot:scaffold25310_cov19-Tisochrysis_lutea.AAC.1